MKDNKKALEIVNGMLSDAKKDSLSSALQELRRYAEELKTTSFEPLVKSISEVKEGLDKASFPKKDAGVHTQSASSKPGVSVSGKAARGGMEQRPMAAKQIHKEKLSELQSMPKPNLPKSEGMEKIDPKTKLSGTMIKAADPMGSSNMNMTPGLTNQDMAKMDPASSPPVQMSEKRGELTKWMSKCMKCMKTLSASENKEKAKDPVMDPKSPQKPASEAYKQKSSVYMNKPKVAKDDQPHPAHSPEAEAHEIVESHKEIPQAVSDLGHNKEKVKKMFDHLRSRKGDKNWERSTENKMAGMEKQEEHLDSEKEVMSQDAERAIMEPSEKPIKIQPNRPGQANKPVEKNEKLTKPYVSDAQRKKFHAMEDRGEISHATVKEWDEASKGKKLPEKKS